jgi:hypothetical protein
VSLGKIGRFREIGRFGEVVRFGVIVGHEWVSEGLIRKLAQRERYPTGDARLRRAILNLTGGGNWGSNGGLRLSPRQALRSRRGHEGYNIRLSGDGEVQGFSGDVS